MKETGVVRKIDKLGRLVIPKEVRRELGWGVEEPVEIFIDGKNVIVAKYTPVCILCGSDKHLTRYRDKNICNDCIGKIREL
jgi:transcriptional pleiotropic regulator of transition state genes